MDEEDSVCMATPGPANEYNFAEAQSIIQDKEKSFRSSILDEALSNNPKPRTDKSARNTTGKTAREGHYIRGSHEKSLEGRETIMQKLSRSQMGADGMQLSHSDANINVSVLHADLESSEPGFGDENSSESESQGSGASQQDNF